MGESTPPGGLCSPKNQVCTTLEALNLAGRPVVQGLQGVWSGLQVQDGRALAREIRGGPGGSKRFLTKKIHQKDFARKKRILPISTMCKTHTKASVITFGRDHPNLG